MIYLDNNATTYMPPSVIKEMVEYCNVGNPGSSHKMAKRSQQMMTCFKKEIAKQCSFDYSCTGPITPQQYHIIFTSGASESNSMIIQRVCDAYLQTNRIPHIITSSIEHKSILDTLHYYEEIGRATVSYIKPAPTGHILPADILNAFTANSTMVCIMQANNEIGSINDIKAIGKLAHEHKCVFYTDAVQSFGKYGLKPIENNVDAFCVSFHKLNGPIGCGALIIKREFQDGFNIKPLIFGTQNDGMRGGTENVMAIAASRLAMQICMTERQVKNKKMLILSKFICSEISSRIPCRTYSEYLIPTNKLPEIEVIFFNENLCHSSSEKYLPNTIFLSIIKRSSPPMCNIKFKEALEQCGIIISVGSACNTSSAKASHVLYALDADELIRMGALRISIGDYNTKQECIEFVKYFITILAKCVKQNHLTKK